MNKLYTLIYFIVIFMDFSKFIVKPICSRNFNNFYCNVKYLSNADFKHLKPSKVTSSYCKGLLTFSSLNLSFVPLSVRNSFQEAVTISTIAENNIFAEATNNWIKKNKDKNHHSLFYKEIFKALLTKKIEVVTLGNIPHEVNNKGLLNQKYTWYKSWILPMFLPNTIKINNNCISNTSKKFVMQQLSASPVFVVKNGFNEILLGHPVAQVKENILEQLSHTYFSSKNRSKQTIPASNGFFFFHPDDAIEFKNFIKSVAPSASQYMDIQVESIGLHFAYKMNRKILSNTQFRFIPDFKEVGDLIYKHRKDKHLIFHKNQYYGKDFFQGQPIYIIQPVIIKDANGQSKIVKFTGLNDDRVVIFTNLEAANKSWVNFIKMNPFLKTIRKPMLLVYNLESFLKEQEMSDKKTFEKFVIVTNKQAYLSTKELRSVSYFNSLSKHLKLNLQPKLFFVQLWIKRLFSTLTYQ